MSDVAAGSVVDASALLEALLRTPAAEAVERRLFTAGGTLHAPHLIDVEVAQVIRRYAAAGTIDHERGRAVLAGEFLAMSRSCTRLTSVVAQERASSRAPSVTNFVLKLI